MVLQEGVGIMGGRDSRSELGCVFLPVWYDGRNAKSMFQAFDISYFVTGRWKACFSVSLPQRSFGERM